MDLLLQRGAGLFAVDHFEFDQFELVTRRHEDGEVDSKHEQQRHQNAAEEVEIDHVAHIHNGLKQAVHVSSVTEHGRRSGRCGVHR